MDPGGKAVRAKYLRNPGNANLYSPARQRITPWSWKSALEPQMFQICAELNSFDAKRRTGTP
jgi:hypothetical protein